MNWTCTQKYFFYDFHNWVLLNLFHTTPCLIATPEYNWRSVVVRPNLSSHLSHIKRESKVGGEEERMKEEKTSSITLKAPVIGILKAEYQKYFFSCFSSPCGVFPFLDSELVIFAPFWFKIVGFDCVLFLQSLSSYLLIIYCLSKVWKSCCIDWWGMQIDPAQSAWESIPCELRDCNWSDRIKPVSGLLDFQRLRWKLICLFVSYISIL